MTDRGSVVYWKTLGQEKRKLSPVIVLLDILSNTPNIVSLTTREVPMRLMGSDISRGL